MHPNSVNPNPRVEKENFALLLHVMFSNRNLISLLDLIRSIDWKNVSRYNWSYCYDKFKNSIITTG